jgi:hypothetical protein
MAVTPFYTEGIMNQQEQTKSTLTEEEFSVTNYKDLQQYRNKMTYAFYSKPVVIWTNKRLQL